MRTSRAGSETAAPEPSPSRGRRSPARQDGRRLAFALYVESPSPGRRSPPRPPRGFTLLEVLVVLTIIGAIAALVAPDLGPALRRSPVERSADRLVEALEAARLRAVRTGIPRAIVVEEGGRVRAAPLPAGLAERRGVERPEEAGEETASLEAGVEARGPAAGVVVFYPSAMSSGGGWTLSSSGADPVTVRIHPLDGAIEVAR